MAACYELNMNGEGQHTFVLKAENGEVILRSEQYESKESAEKGIASVQENSLLEERYDRKDAVNGTWYFNLKAPNHKVIGTSQMYKSAASRETGVESVMANGSSKAITTQN